MGIMSTVPILYIFDCEKDDWKIVWDFTHSEPGKQRDSTNTYVIQNIVYVYDADMLAMAS